MSAYNELVAQLQRSMRATNATDISPAVIKLRVATQTASTRNKNASASAEDLASADGVYAATEKEVA